MKFTGSFPALITPYLKNYTVDKASLRKLVKIHQRFSDGLVLFGSTGEGWLLSIREQQAILETVKEEFDKPIIVGCSVFSPQAYETNVQMLSAVAPIDATLLAVPPYLKLNNEQSGSFYQDCAHSCPETPIIAYHIPARNQVVFGEGIRGILEAIPQVVGIKETIWNDWTRHMPLSRLTWLAGEDAFLKEASVQSSINVGGNIFPEIFSKKDPLFDWDNWQECLNLASNPLAIKFIMHKHGWIETPLARLPLGTLNLDQQENLNTHWNFFKNTSGDWIEVSLTIE